MDMMNAKRLVTICALGAFAGLSGCDNGDDSPPPPPPAPTVTVAANPAAVVLGNASSITWSSTNSTSCVATGSWTGARATSGTESVTPAAAGTATYTLTCTGAGGAGTAAATVTVNAPPPSVPTATLTPASSTVVVGGSTTLTWSSTDATGCTASGAWSGVKPASGNETVTLAALGAANYTLTCTGAGGSVVASATVTAIAAVDFLLTSNDDGNVSVYRLDAATGAPSNIGGSPVLVGGAARTMVFGADNRFAYIGSQNTAEISVHRVDQVTGVLTPITGSPFAGGSPQAMAIHPAGTFLYVAAGNGLFTYAVNATSGALTSVGTAVPGNHGVEVHPSGNFAYAVSAGFAGVYVYAIGGNGALTAIAGSPFAGDGGVEVAIDPTGQFAYIARAIFDSPGTVSAYSINATTGALTPVGSPVAIATGPAMLAIDPQGAFLYVACNGGPTHFGALLGYSINPSTGALTPLPSSPFSPNDHYSTAFAINGSGTYAYETRWRASGTPGLRTLSIGATGALTEVPGSLLSTGHPWTNGIAVTR